MKLLLLCILCATLLASEHDLEFARLKTSFIAKYRQLKIPDLQLSYVKGFNEIQDLEGIARQEQFYKDYQVKLKALDPETLGESNRIEYSTLKYEVELGISRLRLERQYRQSGSPAITNQGIFFQQSGAPWYSLLVKRWTTRPFTIEKFQRLGQAEVDRNHKRIS